MPTLPPPTSAPASPTGPLSQWVFQPGGATNPFPHYVRFNAQGQNVGSISAADFQTLNNTYHGNIPGVGQLTSMGYTVHAPNQAWGATSPPPPGTSPPPPPPTGGGTSPPPPPFSPPPAGGTSPPPPFPGTSTSNPSVPGWPQTTGTGGDNSLPFTQLPAGPVTLPPGQDQFLAGLQNQYTNAYNAASQANQALYSKILSGYQNTAANQRTAQAAILAGYPQLAGQVRSVVSQNNQNVLGAATDAGNRFGNTSGTIAGGYGTLAGNVAGGINSGYGTALGTYGNALGAQQTGQQGVVGGYGQLQQGVANTIQGVDASQRQAIADAYAQQRGAEQQSMISRGLGNTTVSDSVQRGLTLDQQKANIALSNQMAQLQAGYQSSLGLAGLGYQGQAVAANTAQQNLMGGLQARQADLVANYGSQLGLAGLGYQGQAATQMLGQGNYLADIRRRSGENMANYTAQLGLAGLGYQNQADLQNVGLQQAKLGWMNTISAPYPDANQYSNLAMQYGTQQQAQRSAILQQQQQRAYQDYLASLNQGGGQGGGYPGGDGEMAIGNPVAAPPGAPTPPSPPVTPGPLPQPVPSYQPPDPYANYPPASPDAGVGSGEGGYFW